MLLDASGSPRIHNLFTTYDIYLQYRWSFYYAVLRTQDVQRHQNSRDGALRRSSARAQSRQFKDKSYGEFRTPVITKCHSLWYSGEILLGQVDFSSLSHTLQITIYIMYFQYTVTIESNDELRNQETVYFIGWLDLLSTFFYSCSVSSRNRTQKIKHLKK